MPTIIASTRINIKNSLEEIYQPATSKNELPDLIIEDFWDDIGWHPYCRSLYCRVRNIGNVSVDGSICVDGTWMWMRNYFPDKVKDVFHVGTITHLEPNQTVKILLEYVDSIGSLKGPFYGKWEFSLEVNKNHRINDKK